MENWSDIRVFLAVMRAGSTLAAAKTLGQTQTTVARRIEALEHALKLTLFHRDTRGFHPTEAARGLVEAAADAEAANAGFFAAAARKHASETHVIRMTSMPDAYKISLSPIIAEFTERHPEVRFQTNLTDRRLDVGANEVDVAIRPGEHHGASDNVLCRKIGSFDWGLFASSDYVNRFGRPETVEDLANHRVLLGTGGLGQNALNQWLTERTPPENVVARFTTQEGIIAEIENGAAIGPLVELVAWTCRTPLVQVLEEAPKAPTPLWLLLSPDAQKRPIVRALSDLMAQRWMPLVRGYIEAHRPPGT